jgi:hypothetical protein
MCPLDARKDTRRRESERDPTKDKPARPGKTHAICLVHRSFPNKAEQNQSEGMLPKKEKIR